MKQLFIYLIILIAIVVSAEEIAKDKVKIYYKNVLIEEWDYSKLDEISRHTKCLEAESDNRVVLYVNKETPDRVMVFWLDKDKKVIRALMIRTFYIAPEEKKSDPNFLKEESYTIK